VLLFVVMTAANAAASYAYTKDVIMSPAGAFFALAVAVALKQLLESSPPGRSPRAAAAVLVVLVLSATWAVRAIGLHVALHAASQQVRDEWAYFDQTSEARALETARAVRLKEALQADAIWRHPARPVVVPLSQWFDF
jgi:hypothetical protein